MSPVLSCACASSIGPFLILSKNTQSQNSFLRRRERGEGAFLPFRGNSCSYLEQILAGTHSCVQLLIEEIVFTSCFPMIVSLGKNRPRTVLHSVSLFTREPVPRREETESTGRDETPRNAETSNVPVAAVAAFVQARLRNQAWGKLRPCAPLKSVVRPPRARLDHATSERSARS